MANTANYGGPNFQNNLAAFIPNIYSRVFISKFWAQSITNFMCNTSWEGEIKGPGSTLNLRNIPYINVTPGQQGVPIPYQGVQASNTTFQINYSFLAAWRLDDIDRANMDVDFEGQMVNAAVNKLRLAIESTIIQGAYSSAGYIYNTNTASLPWNTNDNSVSAVVNANSLLDEGVNGGEDVTPRKDRYLIIHPAMRASLVKQSAFYALNQGTDKSALYEGFVAIIDGLRVFSSPLVAGSGTVASPYQCYIGHPAAITMATKFTNTRLNIPLIDYTGTGNRIQNYFGYKVVKPTSLVNLQVHLS